MTLFFIKHDWKQGPMSDRYFPTQSLGKGYFMTATFFKDHIKSSKQSMSVFFFFLLKDQVFLNAIFLLRIFCIFTQNYWKIFHLAGQILPKTIYKHKKDKVPSVTSTTLLVGHINGLRQSNLICLVASIREELDVETAIIYLCVTQLGL